MTTFELTAMLVKSLVMVGTVLTTVPLMVWFERRGSAWMQMRVGPNRVGPFGLFQPLADVIKFLLKEDIIPDHVSKFHYFSAPIIALLPGLAAFALIPFGSHVMIQGQSIPMQLANIDSGILLILAVMALEVYAILLAGWSSNSKYAILGTLRSSSQIISYEIAMSLSIVAAVLVYGSVNIQEIVAYQQEPLWGMLPRWGLFLNPIAALIFWISMFAETNRLPFDLPEGESEIVAGYHVEYGSMKFALFFMAEYVAMTLLSAFFVTLFLGGYDLIFGMEWILGVVTQAMSWTSEAAQQNALAFFQFMNFMLKVAFMLFLFVWIRWTIPRFRFDQLMDLGWKILFPLAMVNLALIAVMIYFIPAL
jgi:NADH-quinone oxidoreductase subunit H